MITISFPRDIAIGIAPVAGISSMPSSAIDSAERDLAATDDDDG